MAAVTITNTVKDAAGNPVPRCVIQVQLVPAGQGATAPDGHEVVSLAPQLAGLDGSYSLTLERTDTLVPATTLWQWQITELVSQKITTESNRVYLCTVDAMAGTVPQCAGQAPFPVGNLPGSGAACDADLIVAVDNSTVTSWTDQSGNANHVVSNAGTPTYWQRRGAGGRPAVRFNELNPDSLKSTNTVFSSAYDYALQAIAVHRPDYSTAGPWVVLADATAGNPRFFLGHAAGDALSWTLPGLHAAPTRQGANFQPAYVAALGYDGQTLLQCLNGAETGFGQTNPAASALALVGKLYVGNRQDGGFGYSGDIYRYAVSPASYTLAQWRREQAQDIAHYGIYAGIGQLIACIGDSMTQGTGPAAISTYQGADWPNQMLGLLNWNDRQIANFGVGSRSLGIVNTAPENFSLLQEGYRVDLLKSLYAPGIAKYDYILMSGTNDIAYGATDVQLATYFQAYAADRAAAGWRKGIATCILPRTSFNGAQEAYRVAFNAALRLNYKAWGYAALVDPTTDSHLATANASNTWWTDGTHLTAAGYAIIAVLMAAAVLSLG